MPPKALYYDSLDFNSPMTDTTADCLVGELAATSPVTVVDIGCGWGELLLRLAAACPDATAVGVDHDESLLDRGRANAVDRSLQSRVTFRAQQEAMAPSDIVMCIGAEHVFGSVSDALVELHDLVRPGGRLLFGTLYWERPPLPEHVVEFDGVPDLPELIDATGDAGWRPLALKIAALDDWDRFEFGFMADWEQVVMAAGSEADAVDARQTADAYRNSYLRRRGVLGFAYLTLGRPLFTPATPTSRLQCARPSLSTGEEMASGLWPS